MLTMLDWVVVGVYFLMVFGIAAFAYLRGRKATSGTSDEYFLAGRNSGWFVIGASLFASNIGSEHLIGLAGTGAASGLAVAQFEIWAALILLLLGWLFVPIYMRTGVHTMPAFLESRYSSGARSYLAAISILGYILTKISVTIAAGGIVFETLMGINFWTGALIVVLATGAYTVIGGLKAVLYTDMIQMFVLIGGAIAVTAIGLERVGGWSQLVSEVEPIKMTLWRPISDPDFPWTGILFGAPILGVWYWCTDQFIVQRTLAAKNVDQATGGTIFAAYLKLTPIFLFVLPGVIAATLAEQGQLNLSQSDQALPALVSFLLPVGLRGLVVAGLLAALMSSLSSVFNSCSTVFTYDVYAKFRPLANDRQLIKVGRWATLTMVFLGLLWIPLIQRISGELYKYLQSVQAYISPPIAAVFLLGIFFPRLNSKGAMASLGVGFVVGMIRLIGEISFEQEFGGWIGAFFSMNFLHFAVFLFVLCSMVLVLVSYLTPAEDNDYSQNHHHFIKHDHLGMLITLSLGVVIGVGALWIVFG